VLEAQVGPVPVPEKLGPADNGRLALGPGSAAAFARSAGWPGPEKRGPADARWPVAVAVTRRRPNRPPPLGDQQRGAVAVDEQRRGAVL
jgi:hypothetical protein